MFSSYKAPFHLSCCSQWYWMLKSGMCIEHSDVYHQMNSVLFQLVRHHLKCMVPALLLTGSHHCFQCLGCSRSLDMQSMPWQPGERGYITLMENFSIYFYKSSIDSYPPLCNLIPPPPLVFPPCSNAPNWRASLKILYHVWLSVTFICLLDQIN